jgi:hypothetical protein
MIVRCLPLSRRQSSMIMRSLPLNTTFLTHDHDLVGLGAMLM